MQGDRFMCHMAVNGKHHLSFVHLNVKIPMSCISEQTEVASAFLKRSQQSECNENTIFDMGGGHHISTFFCRISFAFCNYLCHRFRQNKTLIQQKCNISETPWKGKISVAGGSLGELGRGRGLFLLVFISLWNSCVVTKFLLLG